MLQLQLHQIVDVQHLRFVARVEPTQLLCSRRHLQAIEFVDALLVSGLVLQNAPMAVIQVQKSLAKDNQLDIDGQQLHRPVVTQLDTLFLLLELQCSAQGSRGINTQQA